MTIYLDEVKQLTYKPSNDELLQLYALFKQGINGDNTTGMEYFALFSCLTRGGI